MGSATVKQITTDFCPLKSKLCATSTVRPVKFSAYSRSTVTSAEEDYLHSFIDAEADVSSDNSRKANTENSDRHEPTAVRSCVTNHSAMMK